MNQNNMIGYLVEHFRQFTLIIFRHEYEEHECLYHRVTLILDKKVFRKKMTVPKPQCHSLHVTNYDRPIIMHVCSACDKQISGHHMQKCSNQLC